MLPFLVPAKPFTAESKRRLLLHLQVVFRTLGLPEHLKRFAIEDVGDVDALQTLNLHEVALPVNGPHVILKRKRVTLTRGVGNVDVSEFRFLRIVVHM